MKRIAVGLALCLGFSLGNPMAGATNLNQEIRVPIYIDGVATDIFAELHNSTTYISLREMTEYIAPEVQVDWAEGVAVVTLGEDVLLATPGEDTLLYNSKIISVPYGVRLDGGYTTVPVRILGALYGVEVVWHPETAHVELLTASQEVVPEEVPSYSQEELYWLSRIISAESQGESMEGQIAVGNVVLNRVESEIFPNNIYEVIFDDRWGGQFEPVRNGTIYDTPVAMSIEAAQRALEGENVVGDSLYFLAPDLTSNHWIMENCQYITTIGCHWFYQ